MTRSFLNTTKEGMRRQRRILMARVLAVCGLPWMALPAASQALQPISGAASPEREKRLNPVDESDGFYPAVVPRVLRFPADHGAHPRFRTEWWYITGWLGDDIGFQLTFFRSRTRHADENPSRFAPKQLIFAHAALAVRGEQRLRHVDRVARLGSGAVAMSAHDTELRLGNWSLVRIEKPQELYRAEIHAPDFRLRFDARCHLPPVLRGQGGLSRKGPLAQHASYYYSRTAMQVEASLELAAPGSGLTKDSVVQSRTGLAWLDHEWSSSLLMQGAAGWDWIGIHLADGTTLMGFRIRDRQGQALYAHWDRRDAIGRLLGQGGDVLFLPQKTWRSPHSLNEYPIEMEVRVSGRIYRLAPLIADQEVDARASTGGFYWEGAVTMSDDGGGVGRGYLELTGYGEPVRL